MTDSQFRLSAFLLAAVVFTGSVVLELEACETLPSSIHIIKEIYSQGGLLERTCEGEVAVSKCEGTCPSKVRPSAIAHSGFLKESGGVIELAALKYKAQVLCKVESSIYWQDCQCCRESSLRVREATLAKCFDPDGNTLSGDKETYVIKLREPADCKCYRCGESTMTT